MKRLDLYRFAFDIVKVMFICGVGQECYKTNIKMSYGVELLIFIIG